MGGVCRAREAPLAASGASWRPPHERCLRSVVEVRSRRHEIDRIARPAVPRRLRVSWAWAGSGPRPRRGRVDRREHILRAAVAAYRRNCLIWAFFEIGEISCMVALVHMCTEVSYRAFLSIYVMYNGKARVWRQHPVIHCPH